MSHYSVISFLWAYFRRIRGRHNKAIRPQNLGSKRFHVQSVRCKYVRQASYLKQYPQDRQTLWPVQRICKARVILGEVNQMHLWKAKHKSINVLSKLQIEHQPQNNGVTRWDKITGLVAFKTTWACWTIVVRVVRGWLCVEGTSPGTGW